MFLTYKFSTIRASDKNWLSLQLSIRSMSDDPRKVIVKSGFDLERLGGILLARALYAAHRRTRPPHVLITLLTSKL